MEKRHSVCSKCHGKYKSLTKTFQNHLCSLKDQLQLPCLQCVNNLAYSHAHSNILFLHRKQNTRKLRTVSSGTPVTTVSL